MTIRERVAYLKGLVEGMALDPEAKETKVTNAIVDILAEMAVVVETIDEDLDNVFEEIEDIQDDVCDLCNRAEKIIKPKINSII